MAVETLFLDQTPRKARRGEATAFFQSPLDYTGGECLLWPFWRNNMGYPMVRARENSTGRAMEYVHRRICEEVNGPPPTPSHEAAHTCGKGSSGCITKAHLVWKTRLDNQADRKDHGTHVFGERVGTSKMTEDDIREIRRMALSEEQRDIAAHFGIAQSMVSLIVNRKRWAWLE